jgi:dTDP-4-amino-4,6-dideoxygalactose transaminase
MAESAEAPWSIPLARADVGEEEVAAVAQVLRSGWLTAGAVTERFEREFARSIGVRHAIAVTNCTAALHLVHVALGIGPGDEVLCPALTFVASANAARYTGARVVFADVVGPTDLTVSPADLARKATAATKAIVVVHYAGFPCRMDEILATAGRLGLPVIEDCAHAPLGRFATAGGSRGLGALGTAGAFSFFGNKNLTTGEGGMLTTDDDRLAERMRLLRSHGMTTAPYDRFRGHAHAYDVVALGFNYRIDDVRAAIGLVQLARLPERNARRREVFRWYLDELRSVPGVIVPFAERDLAFAAPHILSVVLDRDPAPVRARLARAGVQTSKHYDPVNGFAIYGADAATTPITAGLHLLTLPFGPWLGREQVATVARLLREG